MSIRNRLAIAAGKATGATARLLGMGGGTNLPGRVALLLDPGLVASLAASLPGGCALITGTNGKTTTSALLAGMLEKAGMVPAHNYAGANLLSGIASALVEQADISGRLPARVGLFEVDEAALPAAIDRTAPALVLVTNLSCDQLDRYGELDALALKMRRGMERLEPSATIALNADDARVAATGRGLGRPVVYYGVEAACHPCGTTGGSDGGGQRPEPEFTATDLRPEGMEGTACVIRYPGGERRLRIPLPGLYNVYNALAAFTAARVLGVPADACFETIEGFSAAFGRLERVRAGDRNVLMVLVKNPAGFNEVIRTLCSEPGRKDVLLALSDNIADGRDVSWIWDADFEMFRGRLGHVTCSGVRAWDMALRVKYSEAGQACLEVEPDLERALDLALENVGAGRTLYVVPTYTAMLELREIMARRDLVAPYWERR